MGKVAKPQKKKEREISGGHSLHSRSKEQLVRLRMKLNRFERNQSDPAKAEAGKSKKGWDTTGIRSRINQLESFTKRQPYHPDYPREI